MTTPRPGSSSCHRIAGALLCCALAGSLPALAAKSPPTEDEARAAMLKKMSPAEIMAAGDEVARTGDYERAISIYTSAIELAPSADLYYRVGWIYARLGKKRLAAEAYAMTLQYSASHPEANEELGLLLLENKQREKAVGYLTKAVESDPARWRAHNALGVLADTSGDHATGVQHFEAALVVKPDSAMLLNNLGYSYYLAGNLNRAEQRFQQALKLEPGNRGAKINLGLLHARRGDYDQAIEVMGSAMDKAAAHNDVGYMAFQNGDMAKAEQLFREAIRLSPSYYAKAQQNLQRVTRALATKSPG